MAYLDSLKVVTAAKPTFSPITHRRNKLIDKLQAQIDCIKAKAEGREHFVTSMRTFKTESGEKTKAEYAQKVRPWWYRNTDGKLVFEMRYANKRVELAKGKTGIEVENLEKLLPAIELLMKVVESGELDKSLTARASEIRGGIAK